MSLKLLLTYPHRKEDREIAMASVFFTDFVKSLTQSIKNLCQLDCFTKSLTILFVLIYSELRVLWIQQKRSDILVFLWQKCQFFRVYFLLLKNSITKINAFLVISELMAPLGKVLRSFGDIGKHLFGVSNKASIVSRSMVDLLIHSLCFISNGL